MKNNHFNNVYELTWALIRYIYKNNLCSKETDKIIPYLVGALEKASQQNKKRI